jgi:hypothetical protein
MEIKLFFIAQRVKIWLWEKAKIYQHGYGIIAFFTLKEAAR